MRGDYFERVCGATCCSITRNQTTHAGETMTKQETSGRTFQSCDFKKTQKTLSQPLLILHIQRHIKQ